MRKRKSAVGAGMIGNRDGTIRRLASDIGINYYVDFKGKPCRVLEAYTSESGFRYFEAIDILEGFFVRRVVHSSKEIVVTLLHHSGAYVRHDIKLPHNEWLRSMMVCGIEDGKIVFVTIASALGKEAIIAVHVDPTGSAIGFKPNEGAVNQSKTKDSDVVVNQSKTKIIHVVVNQSKPKDRDVVVNQSKTNNSDVGFLKEKATKALSSKKYDRCENLSTAKYGYNYAQQSYRDVVLGHNATGEEIY